MFDNESSIFYFVPRRFTNLLISVCWSVTSLMYKSPEKNFVTYVESEWINGVPARWLFNPIDLLS